MVPWICDSTISPDQSPAVWSTSGLDSVDSLLRLGKWGLGWSVADRELTLLLGACPTAHSVLPLLVFFFGHQNK